MHAVADLGRALIVEARKVGEAACFTGAEETGAVESDIDEGGLHAGKHTLHPAQDDVADDRMPAAAGTLLPGDGAVVEADGAFEKQLLEPGVFNDSDTGFPGPYVDKDFLGHWTLRQ